MTFTDIKSLIKPKQNQDRIAGHGWIRRFANTNRWFDRTGNRKNPQYG